MNGRMNGRLYFYTRLNQGKAPVSKASTVYGVFIFMNLRSKGVIICSVHAVKLG